MRAFSTRRHQLSNFWTQQLVVCVIIVLFLCVTYLQKVDCASLIRTHQQQQPQQQHPQNFIIDDDGLVLLPMTPENSNNELHHLTATNPNNHNMVTRFGDRNEKRTPLIRKRSQNINNYGFQDRTDARYRAIANLAKIIPDTALLKQLLESELFHESDPELQEQRIGMPELGYRTYPAIQQQNPNERFQPAKRQGGCLFHGGLAHNCDYKDLVGAVDEADHWGSDLSPGKK